MTTEKTSGDLTRRRALTGAAAVGIGLPLLAACGDDGDEAVTEPGASASSEGGSPGDRGTSGGPGLVSTSEVEVGGGVVLPDQDVVVVQPSQGQFKGYSATCTHLGCKVAEVVDGQIHCTCHDSMFSIEDGSPQGGPATEPLPAVDLEVQGERITLA